jgi:hypothetical protein
MRNVMRGPAAAAVLLFVGLVGLAAQKIEVTVNQDKTANFKSIKTYAWLPTPPLPKSVASEELANPNLTPEAIGPHIQAAVNRQFASRGLTAADQNAANVQVIYYAAMTVAFDRSFLGENYGYVTGWPAPIPPGLAPSTSNTVYERGTIVVDVIDPAAKKAIWRGIMKTRVNQENTQERRIARINEAIDRIFEKFPIRRTK